MDKVYVLLCPNNPNRPVWAVYRNSFDAWKSRDYANIDCGPGHTVHEVILHD